MSAAGAGATRVGALRALGWWVLDYAYAAVWQARALVNRTDPESFRSGHRRPVVVLPGVYEPWKFMQPLIEALHARGHPVHVIREIRHNRRPVLEAAEHVAAYLERHDLADALIVAHSKGGLIGKHVMSAGGAAERVSGMLAIATPFGGSRYARLMWISTLRIFSPNDPTIRALALETAINSRIVSVYGRFDPHIPEGSELPGAKNVLLDTGGHFRILADPRVLAEFALLAG